MPAYTLLLDVDSADLKTIQGESIVVARVFGDSTSNVAWASLVPFQKNTVSWDDQYGMYAAVSVSSGSVQPQSMTAVGIPSGLYYNFAAPGIFDGPFSGERAPAAGSYRVFNQIPPSSNPSFVFGLIQNVTCNGIPAASAPANAETVPANQFATFTPLDAVYVWLQSNVTAGKIVQVPPPLASFGQGKSVSSGSTLIQFSGPSTLSCKYSAEAGGFVPSA